jgi:23S rRNA (uracil1939-C5)-methyltransferase
MVRDSSSPSKIVTVTIESIGGLGDGLARLSGKPVYVPKSTGGDELSISIINETKEFARGEIKEVLKPGPDRVAAPCPHYDHCGGCSLQHLTETSYKQFKRDVVKQAIGYSGFDYENPEFHFLKPDIRRRADFKVANGTLTYHGLRNNNTVEINQCLILEPKLQALIAPVNALLKDMAQITHVHMVSVDSGTGVIFYAKDKIVKTLIAARKEWIALDAGLLAITLGNYRVALPNGAFLQASEEAQRIITEIVVGAVKQSTSILDLFSGIGTYSLPVSEFAKVHAVENDRAMVDALRDISPKVTATKRDLFKNPLTAFELKKFNAAIINPPRSGAKAQIEQLAKSAIGTIAMVSCNPATWGRDARILKDSGYKLTQLWAIDQFVWSQHLELVSVFVR